MEQQIPIQCLYYFCAVCTFLLLFLFISFSLSAVHFVNALKKKIVVLTSRTSGPKEKVQIANNCIFCLWLRARERARSLNRLILYVCTHCTHVCKRYMQTSCVACFCFCFGVGSCAIVQHIHCIKIAIFDLILYLLWQRQLHIHLNSGILRLASERAPSAPKPRYRSYSRIFVILLQE